MELEIRLTLKFSAPEITKEFFMPGVNHEFVFAVTEFTGLAFHVMLVKGVRV